MLWRHNPVSTLRSSSCLLHRYPHEHEQQHEHAHDKHGQQQVAGLLDAHGTGHLLRRQVALLAYAVRCVPFLELLPFLPFFSASLLSAMDAHSFSIPCTDMLSCCWQNCHTCFAGRFSRFAMRQ